MKADSVLRDMRLLGARRRAEHYARLLAAEALTAATPTEQRRVELHRLENLLAEATEGIVWLESLRSDRPTPPPDFTDLNGELSIALSRH